MSHHFAPRPLRTLLDDRVGVGMKLPPRLARLYGHLKMPSAQSHPLVFSNFVTSMDGVVSLQTAGHMGGSDVSGHNGEDRVVMGLLRAVADVVMIGAGTLAADPSHIWTPDGICPELADDYRRLRRALRKPAAPLIAVITGSGNIDLSLPVFASSPVQALVITTTAGARRLERRTKPAGLKVQVIAGSRVTISPSSILRALKQLNVAGSVLLEGGPQLLGQFYARRLIDVQFLTFSPQVLGRIHGDRRMSLVMGQLFGPGKGRWGRLTDVRRSASHLFLRYEFKRGARAVLPE